MALITTANTYNTAILLVSTMVGIWSARLGMRILRKNYGKPEDVRYAAWRVTWQKRGNLYFILRSFFQIFILQGAIITFVAIPIILVIANPFTFNEYFLYAGFGVWLCGLLIEALADWQLDSFMAKKKAGMESRNLMTTGLFAYSRRPNYFGETVVWWGLAIIALPYAYGYLALISPLLITYIVTKITGPMLEKLFIEKFGNEYRSYQEKTSYFIPMPPRT